MLTMVNFFVVFVLSVHMAKFDPVDSLDQILFVNMLQIWNLKYFKHCWIIKCVGFN